MKEVKNTQNLLKFTYALVPIAAGADKFLNLLTDWTSYLSPGLVDVLPVSASTFMAMVGLIEIAAGVLVFVKTEIGAYVVSAWLLLIAMSLLFTVQHLDIAVRDIVMSIGAFALARLTMTLNTSDQ